MSTVCPACGGTDFWEREDGSDDAAIAFDLVCSCCGVYQDGWTEVWKDTLDEPLDPQPSGSSENS